MKKRYSLSKRIKNAQYAFNGLKVFLKEEHNAGILLICAALAIVAGWILQISSAEWLLVILAIGLVFTLEMMNSSIERMCDKFSPEISESIRKVKDMAAGAVLVSVAIAIVVGLVVFLPKILVCFNA